MKLVTQIEAEDEQRRKNVCFVNIWIKMMLFTVWCWVWVRATVEDSDWIVCRVHCLLHVYSTSPILNPRWTLDVKIWIYGNFGWILRHFVHWLIWVESIEFWSECQDRISHHHSRVRTNKHPFGTNRAMIENLFVINGSIQGSHITTNVINNKEIFTPKPGSPILTVHSVRFRSMMENTHIEERLSLFQTMELWK